MIDTAAIIDLARQAGAMAVKARQGKLVSWDKGKNDPVSEADLAIDKFLQEQLMALTPDFGWLSEETKDNHARLSKAHVWVVDPIDGTRAYIQGKDDYCISIGLLHQNAPMLGILYVPDHDDLYLAERGKGAFKNDTRLSIPAQDSLTDLTMVGDDQYFGSYRTWPEPWPESMAYIKANSLALRHAWLAEGKGDLVVTANPKCDWDLAAATLLVTEAGGHCGDHHGEPYQFNRENVRHYPVVACHKNLLPPIAKRLDAALSARKNRGKS